jgi:hypothetical protein
MNLQELLAIALLASALLAVLAALALQHWYRRPTIKHLSPLEQLTDSSSLLKRRRSSRIAVSIRLIVSGVFPDDGRSFAIDGLTMVVNRQGALIETEVGLCFGMQVAIIVVRTREVGAARVVWSSPQFDGHYGVELKEPRNIWGVYFPPADW